MFCSICSVTLGVGGISDEVRAELALSDGAEGHVVPDDLALLAVVVDDRVQGDVRVARFDVVGHLDVGELCPADDPLLLLDRDGVPRRQVMQVFLHDHVAATDEVRIFVTDRRRLVRGQAGRILGAIDEAEQVALVEVFEAVGLVDNVGVSGETVSSAARRARNTGPCVGRGCGREGRPAWRRPCAGPR